jgi:hypothetical protein
LKSIDEPPVSLVEKQVATTYHDAPVILQNWDRKNEKNLPFYLSLLVNNKVLHNCMLDSGATSNVITKKVMEQLNLRISRPYHKICALDSQTIEVHGLIKGLQVYLAAFLDIMFEMDIVVIDVNREVYRKYHVEDPKKRQNELKWTNQGLGNYAILSNSIVPLQERVKDNELDKGWYMNFDGAFSRAGKGAGIVLQSPNGEVLKFSYTLEFDATNNVAEYEALILGLEICRDKGIKCLNIKGDSDLVIQ